MFWAKPTSAGSQNGNSLLLSSDLSDFDDKTTDIGRKRFILNLSALEKQTSILPIRKELNKRARRLIWKHSIQEFLTPSNHQGRSAYSDESQFLFVLPRKGSIEMKKGKVVFTEGFLLFSGLLRGFRLLFSFMSELKLCPILPPGSNRNFQEVESDIWKDSIVGAFPTYPFADWLASPDCWRAKGL